MKKSLGLSLLLFITCVGCNKNTLFEVSEDEIEQLNTYNFEYDIFEVPGQSLSNHIYFDGYDKENDDNKENHYNHIPESNRAYTYFVEFEDTIEYYLGYFPDDEMDSLKSFLKSEEPSDIQSSELYFFTTYKNEDIVDSKFFYAAVETDKEADIIWKKTTDLKNAPASYNNNNLISVIRKKNLTIRSNVSKNVEINRTIPYFSRMFVNKEAKKITEYEVKSEDGFYTKTIQKFENKLYDESVGKMLKTSFKDMKETGSLSGGRPFSNAPIRDGEIITGDGIDYYRDKIGTYYKGTWHSSFDSDYYCSHGEEFKNALVVSPIPSNPEKGVTYYGLFDLNKVFDIFSK